MEITVREVMQMEPLQGARVVAGETKLNNIVRGITIIERPDIVEWLEGGEILLTSLYNIHNEVSYQEYIKKMVQKGVSALIIKTGRVVQEIPQEIIQAGNEIGLPIIELGEKVKYIDIMYPVMAKLFNDQVIKLQYYKQVQDRLTGLVIAGEGLDGIVRVLEELLKNPVVIYDKKFQALAATDLKIVRFAEVQDSSEREILNNKFYYYRQKVLLPELNNQKATQIVIPIQQLHQISAYLVVIEINRKMRDLEFIILENASTVVSLELVKRFAIGEVERKFKYDLLDTLVTGDFHLETVLERASLMGWDLRGAFCVVMMEFDNINEYLQDRDNRNTFLTEIGNTVANVINEYTYHFMRIKSDSLFVLWPVGSKSQANVTGDINKAVQKITVILKKKYKNMRLFTGVGGIVPQIHEIAKSFTEAKNAIHYGKTTNESLVNFADLGVMRLLCKFGENNDLREYIPHFINKLQIYDQENNTNLLHTLEVFLGTNSNAAQTAKELFVHYKTVLYRLDKIKEITGIDLNNNKDRLEAELGIKILNLLRKSH
ncbi:MAG TPA: PucR family transcriptional regulator [Peptococcaceae bacterium]|nr:PucR family transcriptional regulator [Peptococcaceae bacterium]